MAVFDDAESEKTFFVSFILAIVIFFLFCLNDFMQNRKQRNSESGLVQTVKQTLTAHPMVTGGDRILVGVSGGPDSMALLYSLMRLAPDLQIQLGIAHLNHCLRGLAGDKDAAMVRETAKRLGIPSYIRSARVSKVKNRLKLSLEDAGRRVRYAFFNKVMRSEGYNKVAVGHQMNDNAEQILLALVRGTGSRGLCGIAPVRENRIIRPLIQTSRDEIETFLKKEGIAFVKDASNDDPRFLRNRVRNHLLPLLADKYNPKISEHLNRLADLTRTEENWIGEIVDNAYEKVKAGSPEDTVHLSIGQLRSNPMGLKRRLIRKALENLSGDLRRISFSHIEAAIRLVTVDNGEKSCHLPGGIRVLRTGNHLVFRKSTKKARPQREKPGKTNSPLPTIIPTPLPPSVQIEAMGIGLKFSFHRPDCLPRWGTVRGCHSYFDYNRISFPLTLRPIEPGDRFTPLGAGGTQKVKKYLIDHQISRQIRAITPVLTDQRKIVWLVGQRMDDHFKVTEETTRILGIEFFLLDM